MPVKSHRLFKRNRKHKLRPATRSAWAKLDWSGVNWRRLMVIAAIGLFAFSGYAASLWVMDRPIESVVINGAFERVSAMQVEDALSTHVQTGFLRADLQAMRAELVAIPWVANVNVRRRWPGSIEVNISEERAAACWGESGLLNIDGELFVRDVTHVPVELPRLAGPEGSEQRVARMFFAIQRRLEQRGMAAVALRLDQRGAWEVRLSSGIRVRLGASFVTQRLDRFFEAVDTVIAVEAERVDYVDMRYTNGFAIGWKDQKPLRAKSGMEAEPHV
ncbi:MAG: FtsQ-type POTRA domain-containing protein [Gammaproteobacteria bacterium]|nr:MAG: FtsQ-type POTRA domain-containing protein [Gammaproteobacteria bacterium]